MKEFLARLSSRKFLLALLAGVLVFANRMWDLGLTDADMAKILTTFGTFIVAEGVGDAVERFNK